MILIPFKKQGKGSETLARQSRADGYAIFTSHGSCTRRDQSCFTLPALSAEGGRLETSTCPKGLVGAYPDHERAVLGLCWADHACLGRCQRPLPLHSAGARYGCTSMVHVCSHQFQPDSQGLVTEVGVLDKQLCNVYGFGVHHLLSSGQDCHEDIIFWRLCWNIHDMDWDTNSQQREVSSVYMAIQAVHWWPLPHLDRPSSSTVLLVTLFSYGWWNNQPALERLPDETYSLIRKPIPLLVTAKLHGQVNFLDLDNVKDVVQPPVFGTATLKRKYKKLAFTWSRVGLVAPAGI